MSMLALGKGYGEEEEGPSSASAWKAFLKPKSLAYLLLVTFCASMLYGFEEYIFPLFAETSGVSDLILSSIGVLANALSYFGAGVLIFFRNLKPLRSMMTAFTICGIALMLFLLNTTLFWAVLVLFLINVLLRVIDNYKIVSLIRINEKDGVDGKMIQENYYAVEDGFRVLHGPVLGGLSMIGSAVACTFLGLLCIVSPRLYHFISSRGALPQAEAEPVEDSKS